MDKSQAIKEWFKENSPWCPLFGVIPFRFMGQMDPPTKARVLDIIDDGRRLWDVSHPLDIAPFTYSWPKPEEISWYPKGELLTARGIFWHVIDIFGASQTSARVHNGLDLDPDQVNRSLILWHASDYGSGTFGGATDVPDYKMLAIFSIFLAWWCLELILSREYNTENPQILKDLMLAEAFLKQIANIQNLILNDRPKKAGRKGGLLRRKLPAVTLAIEQADQKSSKKSVRGLWEYLKNQYHEDRHFVTKDSDIFFGMKNGEIENLMTIRTFNALGKKRKTEEMKDRQIKLSTFKTYVMAYRKK